MSGIINSVGSKSGIIGSDNYPAGIIDASVTGGAGLSGSTSLGTVTVGNLSNSAIVYPAGHIIQVKQGSVGFASSGTSDEVFHDPECEVEITPSSTSNKILVIVTGNCGPVTTGSQTVGRGYTFIWKGTFASDGSANIGSGPLAGHQNYAYSNGSDAYFKVPLSLIYLDSPSTTSAIDYGFCTRRAGTGDASFSAAGLVTLFEIRA